MIGVAVASQKLTVVFPDEETEDIVLPYNTAGLQDILETADSEGLIVLAGNRQWALPLAYALEGRGRKIKYLPSPKKGRGQRSSHASVLKKALQRGILGGSFFRKPPPASPVARPWVELAGRYFLLQDDRRQVIHRIINCLRILFPELISLGTVLWQKGSLEALRSRNWIHFHLRDSSLNYDTSLGRYIPFSVQREASDELSELLDSLDQIEKKKNELTEEISDVAGSHPIVEFFGEAFSSKLLTLLIGWRKWGTSKRDFRKLRSHAGLALTRIDSKGKPRISRVRPNIRTTIFWLLQTTRGKDIIAEAKAKLGRDRMPRTKRIEILLREVWRHCLRESEELPVEA